MTRTRWGVGIVGLEPGRSWAAKAHLPALRALPDDYQIVGVANRSLSSAAAAAGACDIPRAFGSVEELLACEMVDIVTVTVKVPHHFDIVRAALAAKKHVYCEWALGNGLAEARELVRLARAAGTLCVVGTQARAAPEVEHLRTLVADGYVGDVLSATVVGSGLGWGAEVRQSSAYTFDQRNGNTMLTIPFAHTMAAVQDVLGKIREVSGRLSNRRTSGTIIETGQAIAKTSPDQLVVEAILESGAPLSVHYRGGRSRGTGFLWEINGSQGDIQVTADAGHAQMFRLALRGGRGRDRGLRSIELPSPEREDFPVGVIPRNVAYMYARMAADLREGTATAPNFDDGIALHRLVAAVEVAARDGCRHSPDTFIEPADPEVQRPQRR